jgi:hypothetical protein
MICYAQCTAHTRTNHCIDFNKDSWMIQDTELKWKKQEN